MSNPLSVLVAQSLQEDRIRDAQRSWAQQPRTSPRAAGRPWWRRPRRSDRGARVSRPPRVITP